MARSSPKHTREFKMQRIFATGVAAIAVATMVSAPAMAKPLDIGVSMSRAEHLFLIKVRDAMQKEADAIGDTATPPGRRVIALDGKTLRGSFDHLDDQAAAQVLSAFASEAALILAHQEIAEGDEIAAAQALIEQLGLSGILFTADALHCQKNLRRRGRNRQRAAGAGQGQPATLA